MTMNRRDFIRTSGLAASAAALLAACGDTAGPTSPGRLGTAEAEATLPAVSAPSDIELLRTAQSLHHTAVDAHQHLLDSGELPSALAPAVETIIENHVAAAGQIGELVTAAGGASFDCANPFWVERFVEPALAATEGTDNIVRDLLNIGTAIEEIVARSHQALVPALSDPALRNAILTVGMQGTRQAAFLASLAGDDRLVEPTMLGGDAKDADDDGFPIYYVLPDEFAQVGGITLAVGALDEEGTRFNTGLQTPAENSFVYEYMACS